MMHARNIVYYCTFIILHCHGTIHRTPWQFSSDFLEQQTEVSEHKVTHKQTSPPTPTLETIIIDQHREQTVPCTQESHWISVENGHKLINLVTLTYAILKIYERHQAIGAPLPPDQQDFMIVAQLKKIVTYICPNIIQSITVDSAFLIDSCGIACKALIYKTVSQLILLCASGNIIDLIGYGLQKAKHLVL